MPENREALLVMKRFKFPVPNADGVRMEVREFQPGEFLPRQAWDLAPARSRRSMANVGFVRDPLSIKLDPVTGEAESMPIPQPTTVRVNNGGYDRRVMASQTQTVAATEVATPAPKRRGRPPKKKA